MPATASPQVRAPLPNGTAGDFGSCPICYSAEIRLGSDGNRTRSVDPGPNGRYAIHPHHEWCPVLTGETPEVACLTCGAPVNEWSESPGVILTMPNAGPAGRDDHWLGNVEDPGYARNSAWASKREPAPDFDRVTVKPCGHEHEGRRAHEMLLAVRTARAARMNREAEATYAAYIAVTDAAEAAGHVELVLRWQDAVRTGSPEAVGLLAAIRVVGRAVA